MLTNVPEPPDGSWVVVAEWDGDRKVIWREDGTGVNGTHTDERWWDDVNGDPMSWQAHLRYADQLFMVEPEPFAAKEHG